MTRKHNKIVMKEALYFYSFSTILRNKLSSIHHGPENVKNKIGQDS